MFRHWQVQSHRMAGREAWPPPESQGLKVRVVAFPERAGGSFIPGVPSRLCWGGGAHARILCLFYLFIFTANPGNSMIPLFYERRNQALENRQVGCLTGMLSPESISTTVPWSRGQRTLYALHEWVCTCVWMCM